SAFQRLFRWRRANGKRAAQQAKRGQQQPQQKTHAFSNTAWRALFKQKKAPHLVVKRLRFSLSALQRETIKPLLVPTTQRPSCLRIASTRPTPGMESPA